MTATMSKWIYTPVIVSYHKLDHVGLRKAIESISHVVLGKFVRFSTEKWLNLQKRRLMKPSEPSVCNGTVIALQRGQKFVGSVLRQ